MGGDLVRCQRGAGNLDHRTDHVWQIHTLFRKHLFGCAFYNHTLVTKLGNVADQWDHHLWHHLLAFLNHLAGGLEYGTGLHLGDLRIGYPKPAAAMTKHGVGLVQFLDLCFDLLWRNPEF
ncbi:hypothetical protein ES703_105560 [subsurface metagenome]